MTRQKGHVIMKLTGDNTALTVTGCEALRKVSSRYIYIRKWRISGCNFFNTGMLCTLTSKYEYYTTLGENSKHRILISIDGDVNFLQEGDL